MAFVTAVSKTTGEKHDIPEEWLDHPVLGRDFKLAPSARTDEQPSPEGTPDSSWTAKQLTQYAADHGIDLVGANVKRDILAAIHATSNNESPATGEEE